MINPTTYCFFADAPRFDFVFTLCDESAAEDCPEWAGNPLTATWALQDPLAQEVPNRQRWPMRRIHQSLEKWLKIFTSLPIDKLDRLRLQAELDKIATS